MKSIVEDSYSDGTSSGTVMFVVSITFFLSIYG